MIRAVVFDLDGVIRQWDLSETTAIEHRHAIPEGVIRAVAFESDRNERVILGDITDETWREEIATEVEGTWGPAGRRAVTEWSARVGSVDLRVMALVHDLRASLRVGLLTNATSRLRTDLSALQILESFDVIINSSEQHIAKPSPEIFDVVANALGLSAQEWLFIDDTLSNVTGAQRCGTLAHHYQGITELTAWLRDQGVVDG